MTTTPEGRQQPTGTPVPRTPAQQKARNQGIGCLFVLAIIAVLFLSNVLGAGKSSSPPAATERPSAEHQLAIIQGDPSSEAEFGVLLDRLQAGSAICKAEPDRHHAADVIYAGWKASARTDTLLDWARAIASICQ